MGFSHLDTIHARWPSKYGLSSRQTMAIDKIKERRKADRNTVDHLENERACENLSKCAGLDSEQVLGQPLNRSSSKPEQKTWSSGSKPITP